MTQTRWKLCVLLATAAACNAAYAAPELYYRSENAPTIRGYAAEPDVVERRSSVDPVLNFSWVGYYQHAEPGLLTQALEGRIAGVVIARYGQLVMQRTTKGRMKCNALLPCHTDDSFAWSNFSSHALDEVTFYSDAMGWGEPIAVQVEAIFANDLRSGNNSGVNANLEGSSMVSSVSVQDVFDANCTPFDVTVTNNACTKGGHRKVSKTISLSNGAVLPVSIRAMGTVRAAPISDDAPHFGAMRFGAKQQGITTLRIIPITPGVHIMAASGYDYTR